MKDNADKVYKLLERVCKLAEKRMLERSGGNRWTDFKSSFCVRFSADFGWGLVVHDNSHDDELAWVRSKMDESPLRFGETFIWNARTEKNDMLLEASVGDGSIRLPILDKDKISFPQTALESILKLMMKDGCFIEFETRSMETLAKHHLKRRQELIANVRAVAMEFGEKSPQANAKRRTALQEFSRMQDELKTAKLKVPLLSKPYSCLEELEMNLDMALSENEEDEDT